MNEPCGFDGAEYIDGVVDPTTSDCYYNCIDQSCDIDEVLIVFQASCYN